MQDIEEFYFTRFAYKHMKSLVTAIVVFLNYSFSIVTAEEWKDSVNSLQVGARAPMQLKVEQWIRGEPFENLNRGHVYVIEFGATWCGPCRAAIPHLSELAKKYSGKATIVSVYTDKSVAAVESFIQRMGDRIAYPVVMDNHKMGMQKTWMEPSGLGGIPNAFIVGPEATVVWIGHPIDITDDMLDQIINGTFDSRQATAKQEKKRQVVAEIRVAEKMGDFERALKLINQLVVGNPKNPYTPVDKFRILLQYDESEAYAYAGRLLYGQFSESESQLFYLATTLTSIKDKLEKPDWNLAINLVNKAISLCKDDKTMSYMVKYKADVYFLEKNDAKMAIEILENEIQRLNTLHSNEIQDVKQALIGQLKVYKQEL